MTYYNERLLNKSYALEFSSGINSAFILFSLPPQQETFNMPQRVAETKTFAGSVFEDYGNDTVTISLSGTTANSEIRAFYSGKTEQTKKVEYITGEEEVERLRKTIAEYGERNKLENKTVRLYSFSDPGFKRYIGVINSFQIKRSKDSPLSYSYSLEFTGVPSTSINLSLIKSKSRSWYEKITSCISNIKKGLTFLSKGLDIYRTGLDYISELSNALEAYENVFTQYVDTINGFVSSTAQYIEESLSLGDQILSSVARLTLGTGLKTMQSAQEVNKAANKVYKYIIDFPEKNIYSSMIELYGKTAEEIKEVWIQAANQTAVQSAILSAETTLNCSFMEYSIRPGNSNTSDQVIPVYGFTKVKVNDLDSWDSLASEYYGDPSLGSLIAVYNNEFNKLSKLTHGKMIKIPIITPVENGSNNNEVYEDSENNTVYGTDIQINSDGDFDTDGTGDIATVNGIENLSQAIDSRLETSIDSRIRLSVYGIQNTIGSSNLTSNYILASIEETLLAEPRIKTIDKIKFYGNGDKIYIEIEYTDQTNEKNKYKGEY